MKSGTTSLLTYLCQHPRITPSFAKEVHYFDRNHDKDTAWYRAHFSLSITGLARRLSGEATPSYMFNPGVPMRIHKLLPTVKLIAILRDPTERAISHYYHEVAKGRETLSLEMALEQEEARIHGLERSGLYTDDAVVHFSYKSRGRYFEQLERFRELFPRENLLLVDFEELKREPHEALRRILWFLGLDDDFILPDATPRNVGISKAPVPERITNSLDTYFEANNGRLFETYAFNPSWKVSRKTTGCSSAVDPHQPAE